MGLIKIEHSVLNWAPSIVIDSIYDTDSPGPEYYSLSGVQTLEFFKALDSCNDFCGRVEES